MKQRFGVFATFVLTGVLAWMPEWGWSAVVLRLKIKDKCRWIVPVRLNGQGEYGFLVDTGATSTVVDAKLAARLGLQPKGSALSGTYAGKVEVPIAWLENLAIGPRSQVGLDVISVDLGRFFGLDGSIRGILGQDVLSRFNYHIDHRARNLVIEEEGDPEFGPAGARIPFERRGGKPYIEVTVPGVREQLSGSCSIPEFHIRSSTRTPHPGSISGRRFMEATVSPRRVDWDVVISFRASSSASMSEVSS